jgi:hypothetical protein
LLAHAWYSGVCAHWLWCGVPLGVQTGVCIKIIDITLSGIGAGSLIPWNENGKEDRGVQGGIFHPSANIKVYRLTRQHS